jgi:hypothetical protein
MASSLAAWRQLGHRLTGQVLRYVAELDGSGLLLPGSGPRVRHNIASTLAIVAAAGLSGSGRSFRSVGDFAADLPQNALARLGARWHPVKRRWIAPDEATIRRHVKMIDADEADRAAAVADGAFLPSPRHL